MNEAEADFDAFLASVRVVGGASPSLTWTVPAGWRVGPPKAMRLELAQVAKQLEAAGFRVEVVRESMPRHYMIVGDKD